MKYPKNNIQTFLKSYITTFTIIAWLFSLSFMSVSIYWNYITENTAYESSNQNSNDSNQSINNSNTATYTIYKNSDPVINQIELFIAQNQNKLFQEQLLEIEKKRQQRITELMAKKYLDIISDAKLTP